MITRTGQRKKNSAQKKKKDLYRGQRKTRTLAEISVLALCRFFVRKRNLKNFLQISPFSLIQNNAKVKTPYTLNWLLSYYALICIRIMISNCFTSAWDEMRTEIVR